MHVGKVLVGSHAAGAAGGEWRVGTYQVDKGRTPVRCDISQVRGARVAGSSAMRLYSKVVPVRGKPRMMMG
jgi:hypothetical protein